MDDPEAVCSALPENADVLDRQLAATARLLGSAGVVSLRRGHVVVVGIGGVGSWAAEALTRAGVGRLTLIDLDHVSPSNLNRQLHALRSTLGQSKVLAMQTRIHDIDPSIELQAIEDFIDADNVSRYLCDPAAIVLDCIDQTSAKVALAIHARQQKLPLVMCGAAGGKFDPARLRLADLAMATHDPLLAGVRSRLRREAQWPGAGQLMKLACVYSDEPVQRPVSADDGGKAVALEAANPIDASASEVGRTTASLNAAASKGSLTGLACAGYGSLMTVTASMGLLAATWALRQLLPGQR